MFQGSSLFNIVLGMAASLLALSILIQILQEFYKFLFKSKSAAYKKVLLDLIGSQAAFLWEAPENADYRVRGPWDFFRRNPGGILQPLAKEQLADALSRAAPAWVTRTLKQIKQEQAGSAAAAESVTWKAFLQRLGQTERGTTGFGTAREIAGLLSDSGHEWKEGENTIGQLSLSKPLDLAKLEATLRQEYLPQVEKVKKDFDLIDRNLEFTYKRRNLRQTFLLGILVAFVMSYPVQDIYKRAAAMTDEQVVAMTEQLLDIHESRQALAADSTSADTTRAKEALQQLDAVIKILNGRLGTTVTEGARKDSVSQAAERTELGRLEVPIFKKEFWKEKKPRGWLAYILGCFATAILLSFGAPFWNDIAKSVLNLKKSMARTPATTAPNTATAEGSES